MTPCTLVAGHLLSTTFGDELSTVLWSETPANLQRRIREAACTELTLQQHVVA